MGGLFSSLKRRILSRRAARQRRNLRNFRVYRDGLLVEVTEKNLLEDSAKFSNGRKNQTAGSKQFWKSPYANKSHIQPIVYSISVNRDLGIGEITSLCHRFRCEDDDTLYGHEDDEDDSDNQSNSGQTYRPNSKATLVNNPTDPDENNDGRPGTSRGATPADPERNDSSQGLNSDDGEVPSGSDSQESGGAGASSSQPNVYVTVHADDVEVKDFPDFVTPFLNRDIRIRLKFHKAVHSTFQQTFSKYEPVHLWRHVKFIDARFLCHPLQNRIKIMLEESHGNRRKPFGTPRRSRPLFPRAIIVNRAHETPGLYVAGKEFSILLGPPPGGARLLDDGRTLYALGTYVRYLDTDRNYLMIWRATIVETAAEG